MENRVGQSPEQIVIKGMTSDPDLRSRLPIEAITRSSTDSIQFTLLHSIKMASYKMTCFAHLFIASIVLVTVSALPHDDHHPHDSPCWEKAEKGTCDQKLTRYFHNHDDDKCEPFTYGGCGGNGNNFKTYEACQKECAHKH